MVRTAGCGVQPAQRPDLRSFRPSPPRMPGRFGKRFVLQRKFRATHSGPVFVGGGKQFSVASTVVEAHFRTFND